MTLEENDQGSSEEKGRIMVTPATNDFFNEAKNKEKQHRRGRKNSHKAGSQQGRRGGPNFPTPKATNPS